MKNKIKKKIIIWSVAISLSAVFAGRLYGFEKVAASSEICIEDSEGVEESVEIEYEMEEILESNLDGNLETEEEIEADESLTPSYSERFDDETWNGVNNEETIVSKPDEAELLLSVTADSESIKAGSDLVYTIYLENPGNVPIQNISLKYEFSENISAGIWTENDIDVTGEKFYIDKLDAGMEKGLYLTFVLPEEQEMDVSLKLRAEGEAIYEDHTEKIVRETTEDTDVEPLKVSFEVTKSADRSVAVPGDRIIFQICIRNTGERTLHSVITTERFQLGNVPVEFIEKEGVVLNKNKTKARIDQILPGKAVGLEAAVTLPEGLVDQKLLNEVTVTTQETGEKVTASQAQIQIKSAKISPTSAGKHAEESETYEEGKMIAQNPKTGDAFCPVLWSCMTVGAFIAAVWLLRYRRGSR